MAKSRLFLGLMSGTSVDAIDAALVRVWGDARDVRRIAVVGHREYRWPEKLRKGLLATMAPAATRMQEICELNVVVAEHFARAAVAVMKKFEVKPGAIDAIGSHGQTVCHLPVRKEPGARRQGPGMGSTLQLGDVSVIATLTGVRTVGNFRPADMAVGGQGAPLVPWTDAMMFGSSAVVRCVQNIGGIANVTFLKKQAARSKKQAFGEVIAFDTGPGNVLMDAVVQMTIDGSMRYDHGGKIAARGKLNEKLFSKLREHPYFKRRPPKSTGREEFGASVGQRLYREHVLRGKMILEDLVATLARLTAWSIVDAYVHHLPELPEEVVLCGGGADNPTLVRMLAEEFGRLGNQKTIRLRRIEEFGIANKAKEAVSFGLLAMATLDGVPANLPSVTGAERGVVLGVVAPG